MSSESFVDKLYSPVPDQPFIWYAKMYGTGYTIYEFDDTKKEFKFDKLNTSDVDEFGFLGMGGKIYFKTRNGIFHLDDDRPVNVYLENDNGKIKITDNPVIDYHNIIERKRVAYDFSPTMETQQVHGGIAAYELGHKYKFTVNDITFNYSLIYSISMIPGSFNYASLRISSDKSWDGDLHLECMGDFVKQNIHLGKDCKPLTYSIGI